MKDFWTAKAARIVLTALLVLAFSIGELNQANAFGAPLFKFLIKRIARSADDALKHGDEVLKRAMPKPHETPSPAPRHDSPKVDPEATRPIEKTPPNTTQSEELHAGLVIGRTAPRLFKHCKSRKIYPRKTEIIETTGHKVNARSCGSTKCSVIGQFPKKGRYRVNVIDRKQCWIKFQFQNSKGLSEGFVYEKLATVE